VITDIFISYSWWAILLVLFVGFVFASVLYYRNSNNKLSKRITIVLFILRFVGVTLLAFLLLAPFIRTKNKVVERPIIIVGIDNSKSIVLSDTTENFKLKLNSSIRELQTKLNKEADVDVFTFGESVRDFDSVTFSEEFSDYSSFINFIRSNYASQNIASVLIIGDGLVNAGTDPVSSSSDLNCSFNIVALGDTSVQSDIMISDIRYNSVAYTDDYFPIEVSISSTGLMGTATNIFISENGKKIDSKKIEINSNSFSSSYKFNVLAKKTGKRRFRIEVDGVDGESVLQNNYSDVFIDVLSSRLKILLLGAAPHPDIGAIKQSLIRNPNFDVTVAYPNTSNLNISDFDIALLYQFPGSGRNNGRIMRNISELNMPTLLFVGNNTDFNELNKLNPGLRILQSGSFDMAFFKNDESFSKFSFSHELIEQLESYPPLNVPIANYIISEGSDLFGVQVLNDMVTDFPMMLYYSDFNNRYSVFVGEGYWLWRIQSMAKYGNTAAFDALLSKSIMYLTADVDTRRLRVFTEKSYNNRSNVIIRAQYFNETMEPDNAREIELSLTNEKSEVYKYLFSSKDEGYILDLRRLPVGVYNYSVTVADDETLRDDGEFIVVEVNIEGADLQADHRLLSRLAKEHNGKLYSSNEMNKVADDLIGTGLKSKIHFQETVVSIISMWPVMLLILLVFSLEWFLRKYFGSY
jgi:hypothetical protein